MKLQKSFSFSLQPFFVPVMFAALVLASPTAQAHSFGQRFTLPLPFWMYASAASAALLISFIALFAFKPSGKAPQEKTFDPSQHPSSMFKTAASALGFVLMGLAVFSGLKGVQAPENNFSMTYFWIVYLIGFFYLSVLAGPLHGITNPWYWALTRLENTLRKNSQPPLRYPQRLNAWPVFLLYMGLITLELFGHASPAWLAWCLVAYTAWCTIGVVLFGSPVWFANADVFQAMFNVAGKLSVAASQSPARFFQRTLKPASVLLIIAMLASTSFDALRESLPWGTFLWTSLLTLFPQPTNNPFAIIRALGGTYVRVEQLAWWLMPAAYWLAMALTVKTSMAVAPNGLRFQENMSHAALALLPLVLGYHLAHYFTLLLTQGVNIVHLVSDPLGQGWNLLGTANLFRAPVLLEAETIWNIQIVFIIAGHIGGVVLSHRQASSLHSERLDLLKSQLPSLLWMVGLTSFGLWTLSQPVKA